MKTNTSNEIFRLSAILYADNNYEVSSSTTFRKIVESAIFENGNEFISIPDLCIFIAKIYDIIISEEEIINIISHQRYTSNFTQKEEQGEQYIKLSNKRLQLIEEKITEKTIDEHIQDFEKLFNVKALEIIHRFLYELFSNDVNGFQRLISSKKATSNSVRIEAQNYSEEERNIINSFLNWDNPQKDKAIFDISSYAIEYAILTNNNKGVALDSFRNKHIYLDTNIIYRALGINGKNRKDLTTTFLSKFNEIGQKLFISKYTDEEFKSSIKFHIDNIRKFNNPKIASSVYVENSINDEIYNFYHLWKQNHVNPNLEIFQAYIYSIYEEFIDKYNIEIDKICPFDPNDEDICETLKEMSSKILSEKNLHGIVTYENSSYIDALNILWIEQKRNNKHFTFHETNSFLVSCDQILRRWDYYRNDVIPIVLLPSQWLSIILRFFNRTNNDFRSFVNFLNLHNNEPSITGEQLHIVLSGISEISSDPGIQRNILNIMTESHFKNIIDSNDIQTFENSKEFAKSEVDKEIAKLKSQTSELESNVEELKKDVRTAKENQEHQNSAYTQLLQEKKSSDKKLEDKVEEYNNLTEFLKGNFVNKKIKLWRYCLPLLIILGIILLILYPILCYCDVLNRFNAFTFVDNLESESLQSTSIGIITAIYISSLPAGAVFCWHRLFSKERRKHKIEQLEKVFYDKLRQKQLDFN